MKLDGLWRQIVEEGKVETVFHDGVVDDADLFRALMQSTMSVGIWDLRAGKWAFFMWARLTQGLWAEAHFCSLGRYKKGAAMLAFETYKRAGLYGLIGMIPATNVLAQKWAASMDCKKAGTIPDFFRLTDGRRAGAVIFHHRFKGG